MIKDVSPELYEAIKTEFEKKISGNSAIKSVMDSIESGNSTFRDAYKYAETLGDALAESFDKILSSDTLPDGKMYYNIAKAVVEPFLRENYEATADVAAQVQKVLNTKAKIGMNAITPEVDEDKTKGIIDYISNAEQFDNVKKSFVDSTLNYTQSAVDDTIEQNVDFHAKSGMNPVVTRITVGRVCDWCKSLAGVHKYPVDRDVYRRHENCRCIVEYDPGDGKKQDVWSKITYTEKESQERIERKEFLEKLNSSMDYMGKPSIEKYTVKEGDKIKTYEFKTYKNDLYDNIWCQTYSKNSKETCEYVNKKLDSMGYRDKLDRVIVARNASIGGASTYDYTNNALYISEELINPREFKRIVSSRDYPATNIDEVLVHEVFGHKQHWDSVRQFYAESSYGSLMEAKQKKEENLRNYIKNAITSDPTYIINTVSRNAFLYYVSKNTLNELIADGILLIEKNEMKDPLLKEFIKGVLR